MSTQCQIQANHNLAAWKTCCSQAELHSWDLSEGQLDKTCSIKHVVL